MKNINEPYNEYERERKGLLLMVNVKILIRIFNDFLYLKKVKFMLKFYTLIALLCIAHTTKAGKPIDLHISNEEMIKNIRSPTKEWSMELPEFEIYNQKGEQILSMKSLPSNFKAIIKKSLLNEPHSNVLLSDKLKTFLDENNAKISQAILPDYEYVFVEYWAEWCAPCHLQMKAVNEFIQNNSEIKITWLKVEKDPTKLESMEAVF